jgi:CheY-like chemotaxis protein
VLVIDDEAPIRVVARRTLEAAGYRVIEAANGAEALAAHARAPARVRAAIVDMNMPIMDGPTTIRALQHLDADLGIVAASGLGANGPFARAAAAGVRQLLQKPYTAELLLRTIRDVLDGR